MQKLLNPKLIIFPLLLLALHVSRAQAPDPAKQIEATLRNYFAAMSTRDVPALQAIMDKSFVIIEAGRQNARLQVVDTVKGRELLPPEGNKDWDKEKMILSAVKAEVSPTHPSVAMASFTLSFPLSAQRVAEFQDILKQNPAQFSELEKKAIAKIVADRAVHNSMFAMLAKQNDQWKILCMTFPK